MGTGQNWSINEIASFYGKNAEIQYIPYRSGEYDVTLCDIFEAHNKLGYSPKGDITKWIRRFVHEVYDTGPDNHD